jgi:hypothetical protein
MKALARRREDRYTTGYEMARALDPIVHTLGWDEVKNSALVRELIGEPEPSGPVPITVTADSDGVEAQTRSEPSAGAAPRRRWGRIAIAMALGAAVTVMIYTRTKRPVAPPAPPAVAPSSASSTELPVPIAPVTDIAVVISSSPQGAEIFFDDETTARGHSPLAIRLPRAPGSRRARLVLPGYRPAPIEVPVSKDGEITVKLEADPRTKKAPTPATKRTPHDLKRVINPFD